MTPRLKVLLFLLAILVSFTLILLLPSATLKPQASLHAQGIPRVNFSRSVVPGVAGHIARAQRQGKPRTLNRLTGRRRIDRNRRQACRNFQPIPGVLSCDEYPFASSRQGGRGASVAGVPPVENNIQGGILSVFYRVNLIPNGGPFRVTTSP